MEADRAPWFPDRGGLTGRAAGFVDVELRNRNGWYRELARAELDRLTGAEHERFVDRLGADEVAVQVRIWSAMVPVLESGEHCPAPLPGAPSGLNAA